MIRVILADHQTLTREGVITVLSEIDDIDIVGIANSPEELKILIWKLKPNLVIMDHNGGRDYSANDIQNIYALFDFVSILMLSNKQQKNDILEITNHGIKTHISKECSRSELINAVYATARGEQFFCEITMQILFGNKLPPKKVNGMPLLSFRETEIVQLIAEGNANKDIAEKLFLSIHTIKTHRKNIIKKLGFTFKHASELILLLSYLNDIFI